MNGVVRPSFSFVLHLWCEPGTQELDACWRGRIRLLGSNTPAADMDWATFTELEKLPQVLRQILMAEEVEE